MAKTTAVEKLALSKLNPREVQLELLKQDLDINGFHLQMKRSTGIDLEDRISEARISQSVDQSTTITVTVSDNDHALLRSGRLASRNDVQIEGLWFRLTSVDLPDHNTVTLTFEDREIAVLREYTSRKIVSRTQMTRAQFIRSLVREPHEFVPHIPCVIPELKISQAVEVTPTTASWSFTNPSKDMGLPQNNDLTVKSAKMSDVQRRNAETILQVGSQRALLRPLLVMAMMAAIQESSITNLPLPLPGAGNYISSNPDFNPKGVFQQIKHWGWPASGDVATDAGAFFDKLETIHANAPTEQYYQQIEDVQRSGQGHLYAQWRTEAERIVSSFGLPPTDPASANAQDAGSGQGGDYHYFRGVPPTSGKKKWGKENSWACIQRLAEEVNWRAFFVAGTFYYMSEGRLFAQRPVLTIDHDTDGVQELTGQYSQNTKVASMDITARLGRFQVPPGSVVQVRNCGPYNGRWLVSQIERSIYDAEATVTLSKPRPKLPEPNSDQLQLESSWSWTGGNKFLPPNSEVVKTAQHEDHLSAQNAAQKILHYYTLGQYRDDNGQSLAQIKATANGQPVRNQCGKTIYISALIMNALVALLDAGFYIGTFAICSDHDCLTTTGTQSQHPLGLAVDISSVGTLSTGWGVVGDGKATTTAVMKQVMRFLQPTAWQLICNGNRTTDPTIQALQMNQNKPQGGWWVDDHLNHIHYGAAPTG